LPPLWIRRPYALCFFIVSLCISNSSSAESLPIVRIYQTNNLEGWRLIINQQLTNDAPALQHALDLLRDQLREIIRIVPAPAVEKLRQVTLWFSPEYPGIGPKAEYHPGAGWLRDNGRNEVMVKGIEFTNVRIFERETQRMPIFVLHELAHAYHDRFLTNGFENAEIKAAFERAKASGTYDHVERWNGPNRPKTNERSYAMTNPMEYFAESTEAHFSRNDFFPFTRAELEKHDPEMARLIAKLWGIAN
jgi:hypothetical protein